MRPIRVLAVSLCCAVSSGCVTSLQPAITERDAHFAPELVGTWTDSANTERAVITRSGARGYGIAYTDDRGETKRFIGRLGRVGAHHVLDLENAEPETAPGDSSGTHLALVLDTIGLRISVAVLEPDTLNAYLQAHPRAVAHRRTKDETVLTASSADLSKFLAVYLQRPGVLSEPALWIRRAP